MNNFHLFWGILINKDDMHATVCTNKRNSKGSFLFSNSTSIGINSDTILAKTVHIPKLEVRIAGSKSYI